MSNVRAYISVYLTIRALVTVVASHILYQILNDIARISYHTPKEWCFRDR